MERGAPGIKEHEAILNRFLVEVFNEVLKTEERCLAASVADLSLRELHLIEEVCLAEETGRDNRATAIAAAQRVTAGTLTTAVTLLEKKGYLERRRDDKDRRAVRIVPTDKARAANAVHAAFHHEMVRELTGVLSPDETESLSRALGKLAAFFHHKYRAVDNAEPDG